MVVTLSVRRTASNAEGTISSTINSSTIASAARLDLFRNSLRSLSYSGQVEMHTTTANEMAGMKGSRTR